MSPPPRPRPPRAEDQRHEHSHHHLVGLPHPGQLRRRRPLYGPGGDPPAVRIRRTVGYDGAWIRQRHLEHSLGSAAVFLAAAGQRTERVELGTAVIPIRCESPFRLAEDLALADVLSRGRVQVGFSTGMPHAELLSDLVYDGDWRGFDLSYGRIARLVENLRGDYLGGPETVIHSPGNIQRPRLQPHNPDLVERIWYGGGSLRSVRWVAENSLNLLSGNIVSGEDTDDFTTAQLNLISEYRRTLGDDRPTARVPLGRVIVPFDGADAATRVRYRDYAASRARAHPEAADHGGAGPEAVPVRPGLGRHRKTDPGTAGGRSRPRAGVRAAPEAAVRVPNGVLLASRLREPSSRTTSERLWERLDLERYAVSELVNGLSHLHFLGEARVGCLSVVHQFPLHRIRKSAEDDTCRHWMTGSLTGERLSCP
ncbi:LLM class flavin-dependent oxidoreductase [Streptomyces sp. NPDC059680]|uniref:LLM class flavin-dependent oxidoreductase n=1 Tax=Streptomyces sp. NPDC059680 TaxID=3346904 RepID=UPI0036C187E6